MMSFDELFGGHRVMTILRGRPPAETVALANAAWDAGVSLLEVPIGAAEQVPSLAAAVAAGAERGMLVGAGTVVTVEQVRAAARAGARYTVAPGFDPAVLAASLEAGMPHLPGVATASEVQRARGAGCRWVKAFPAVSLGTGWFEAIRGPFPDLHYVATGGITVAGAPAFLEAGARVVALGSALTDPAQRERLGDLVVAVSAALVSRSDKVVR
jgi:2-dehydro-3-deoxyphosphogluconate aldolase/(4S)-4-hydroxy-2-oxoglutarate aldolase